ncbi:MAG: hypothetical protein LC122_12735 [Chitinophagales bacterium]|nr:hypothetical protein [Chitinophagales bacterium]
MEKEKYFLGIYRKNKQILYKSLILYSFKKLTKQLKSREDFPDLELLKYSENFLGLYRREQVKDYLEISIIFRKAAHKMHRYLVKNKKVEKHRKFLNLV